MTYFHFNIVLIIFIIKNLLRQIDLFLKQRNINTDERTVWLQYSFHALWWTLKQNYEIRLPVSLFLKCQKKVFLTCTNFHLMRVFFLFKVPLTSNYTTVDFKKPVDLTIKKNIFKESARCGVYNHCSMSTTI